MAETIEKEIVHHATSALIQYSQSTTSNIQLTKAAAGMIHSKYPTIGSFVIFQIKFK